MSFCIWAGNLSGFLKFLESVHISAQHIEQLSETFAISYRLLSRQRTDLSSNSFPYASIISWILCCTLKTMVPLHLKIDALIPQKLKQYSFRRLFPRPNTYATLLINTSMYNSAGSYKSHDLILLTWLVHLCTYINHTIIFDRYHHCLDWKLYNTAFSILNHFNIVRLKKWTDKSVRSLSDIKFFVAIFRELSV